MPTMTQVAKKILVTCALPYANGSIHLGHMLEHIQADVWVRYQRMRGHEVNFICADDAHGTPIMLKAQQLGITPEQMIGEMSQEHQTDFAGFRHQLRQLSLDAQRREPRAVGADLWSPERERFY